MSFILKIDFLRPPHYFQDTPKYSQILIFFFFFCSQQASSIHVQWHRTTNWFCQFWTCSSIGLLTIQSIHKHNLICKLSKRNKNHSWRETEGKIWGWWVIRRNERELHSNEKLKMFFISNYNIIVAVTWTPVGFDTTQCKQNIEKKKTIQASGLLFSKEFW